jgi:hypothetical protein
MWVRSRRIVDLAFAFGFFSFFAKASPVENEWRPAGVRLMTRWGKQVTPANAWLEYPRPQMMRERWLNLNGLWEYAIEGESGEWRGGRLENATASPLLNWNGSMPKQWDGKILVPFAIESALSGVGKLVRPNQLLWYRRTFRTPPEWKGSRIILNFGAVDWHSIVLVNGKRVAENKGGYVPFSADITEALRPAGDQELALVVWDPTNAGDQAVGKQSLPEMRQGYRYTPTTGIWQTVWIEPVPAAHIQSLRIVPDVDRSLVRVTVGGPAGSLVRLAVFDGSRQVATAEGRAGSELAVRIPSPKLWSPEHPFLYRLKVWLGEDHVTSYFGMRKIAVQPDRHGVPRYYLNNQPLTFQYGPLNQGYWPDGGLTPPSDRAAEDEVRYLKDIGCNMVRVHVNVRPERWYYHCDRLGLLVWQDFVCTRRFDSKITPASARQWEDEQRRMIDALRNHPFIIQWVVFNEGWGQYDTERLAAWTKSCDPERLVTAASGWVDVQGLGDVRDLHDYSFFPSIPPPGSEKRRVVVLGEFGGFEVGVPGHLWYAEQQVRPSDGKELDERRPRYRDGKQWLENYARWLKGWRYLIGLGLSAGVYTQISDVEHELNGWLTYDREVSKIPVVELRRLHKLLYSPPPRSSSLAPAIRSWRWSATAGARCFDPALDDASWPVGSGPYDGKEVCLRASVGLDKVPRNMAIAVTQPPGDAELYLNGQPALRFNNRGVRDGAGISVIPLPPGISGMLTKGNNRVAVRLHSQGAPAVFVLEFVELEE